MARQRRSITDIVCENCIYRVTHASEFSELLELIYAFGAERGVRWSEDAQEAIEWAKRTGRKVAA
ncbi:NinE family protein [Cronobacter sakazakii]|uniref:NinE family protein n=1 Tax=Cronobacter sakazakii TaxID=28141 RepID=UPI003594349D